MKQVLFLVTLIFFSSAINAQNLDKLSIKCREGNEKACLKLVDIVKNHEDKSVSKAAIGYISDERVLADLAKEHSLSVDIKEIAVAKIKDQEILADIVKDPDMPAGIKEKCIDEITSENILAGIAKDPGVSASISEKSIKKITDEKILKDVVLDNSLSESIHEIALVKISDQNLIADIVKDPGVSVTIREKSVKKITDQNLIADIAQNIYISESIRKMVVNEIADPNILTEIAKGHDYKSIRIAAIDKITDQDVLFDIVSNEHSEEILAAVEKITESKKVLEEIGKMRYESNFNSGKLDVYGLPDHIPIGETVTFEAILEPGHIPESALFNPPGDIATTNWRQTWINNNNRVGWSFDLTVSKSAALGKRQIVIVTQDGQTKPEEIEVVTHIPKISDFKIIRTSLDPAGIHFRFKVFDKYGELNDLKENSLSVSMTSQGQIFIGIIYPSKVTKLNSKTYLVEVDWQLSGYRVNSGGSADFSFRVGNDKGYKNSYKQIINF